MPDVSIAAPLPWLEISESERSTRGELTTEYCTIDGEQFYVRAVLELPIAEADRTFAYGVWVSLSAKSFERFMALRERDPEPDETHWFGWLSVRLGGYPDTFCLKTHVFPQPSPARPKVELEPTDHPLALEQRVGVRMARVKDIVELALHPEKSASELRTYPHVQCGGHGEAHGCFVCGHLGDGSGFHSREDPDDPWPDAWCDDCERLLVRHGRWTDEIQEHARIRIVCHHCYESMRARATAH